MILVPLVLVIALVVLAVTGAVAFDWRAVVGVVAALGVLVVLTAGIGVLGFARDDGDPQDEADIAPAPATTAPPVEARHPAFELRPVDVVLARGEPAREDEFASAPVVLDGLPDASTLLVGFDDDAPVVLRQCAVDDVDRPRACGAASPVGWWEPGQAGLVELRRSLATPVGPVDCGVERCVLVAVAPHDGGVVLASATLVFGGRAPAPALRLDGPSKVQAGDRVTVRVDGLRPSEQVTVVWCVPPGPVDPAACGGRASTVELSADSQGRLVTRLPVPDDGVGRRDAECGPRRPCAIAVLGASVPLAPVEVRFAGAPGPDLPAGRVVAGLFVATLLAGVAAWLIRRRPLEHPVDPFAGVSLDVPEWEGIDLSVDTELEEALAAF